MSPLRTSPLDEAPSGLPEPASEPEPLGVPGPDADRDDPPDAEDDLPGIVPDGEDPPNSG